MKVKQIVGEQAKITKSDVSGVEITAADGVKTTLPPEKVAALTQDPANPNEYDLNPAATTPTGNAPAGPKVGANVEMKTAEAVEEGAMSEIHAELSQVADNEDYDTLYQLLSDNGVVGQYLQDKIQDITGETGLHPKDDFEQIEMRLMDIVQQEFGGQSDDEGGETDDNYAMASAGYGSDEDYEEGIPGNVPTEKIPGKEDLLKGRGRKYYESADDKLLKQMLSIAGIK